MRTRPSWLLVVALAVVGCADDEPVATGSPSTAATVLTREGLGELRIGMTFEEAAAAGLVGEVSEVCDIVEPPGEAADLLPPAAGTAFGENGVISSITVRAEGVVVEPGGVGVGDDVEDFVAGLEAAGLSASVDDSPESLEMYGTIFIFVTDGNEGVFGAAADPETGRVDMLYAPNAPFCE